MSEAAPLPEQTSPGPVGDDVAGSCDINAIQKLQADNPNGFLLLIAQNGCGDCTEMEKVLAETIGDRKPIVKADLTEDEECLSLAQQLKAGVTPTVIYFEGGKEIARLAPDGQKTWDNFRGELKALVARPPVSQAAPV